MQPLKRGWAGGGGWMEMDGWRGGEGEGEGRERERGRGKEIIK